MSWKKVWYYLLVLSLTSVTGCSDYWWTRGQPPSVAELLARSSGKLEKARSERKSARPLVAQQSEQIQSSFTSVLSTFGNGAKGKDSQLVEALNNTQQNFINLEGSLSVGSRAAYAELSGQLRAINQSARKGDGPKQTAVSLLASRTYAFLANELSVPAP